MSKPKVSVIVPVFNTEKYLGACLNSISRQSLANIEIICVDDGSTDSSPDILREYAARDPRIRIVTQENRGAGAARNAGMDIASGKYYSFLDSDDYYDTDMLSRMVKTAEDTGAEVTICGSYIVNESTGVKSEFSKSLRTEILPSDCFSPSEIKDDIFGFSMGWAWDKLFLAEHVDSLRFQEIGSNNDVYFVFTSMASSEKIAIEHKSLCYHRKNTNNSLQDRIAETYENIFVSRKALYKSLKDYGLSEMYGKSFFTNLKDKVIHYAGRLRHTESFGDYCEYLRNEVAPVYGKRLTEGDPDMDPTVTSILEGTYHVPRTVSVIIPVYNSEEYLKDCLDSVVSQDIPDLEVICVDDGSTDGSAGIMEKYASDDDRIKIITQKNGGAGTARNAGIDASDSEYLLFLDSDDVLEENCLSALYRLAENSHAEILKTKCSAFDDKTGETVANDLYELNNVKENMFMKVTSLSKAPTTVINSLPAVPWNGLYSSEFVKENGIRFNDLACVNDRSFHVATVTRSERIFLADIPMVRHRVNNGSSLIGGRFDHFDCEFRSFEIIRKDVEDVPSELKSRILRNELGDVFGWYSKACDQDRNDENLARMMERFVMGLDVSELGNLNRSSWYKAYIKILYNILRPMENPLDEAPEAMRHILMRELFSGELGRVYSGKTTDPNVYTALFYYMLASKYRPSYRKELCDSLIKTGDPDYCKDAFDICKDSDDDRLKAILARMYFKGIHVEQDLAKAAELLEPLYRNDSGIARTYTKVLDAIGTAESRKRSLDIKIELGQDEKYLEKMWNSGDDMEIFKEIVTVGADRKNPLACGYLGRMYASGKSVGADLDKAAELMGKAADGGVEWAASEVLNILWKLGDRGSVTEMLIRAQPLADKGNKNAISHMAKAFRYGKGTECDLEYAAELLRGIYKGNKGWTRELVEVLNEMGDEASLEEANEIMETMKENGEM